MKHEKQEGIIHWNRADHDGHLLRSFFPTRPPYAGIICFSVLLVKGFLTITNGSIQMNLK